MEPNKRSKVNALGIKPFKVTELQGDDILWKQSPFALLVRTDLPSIDFFNQLGIHTQCLFSIYDALFQTETVFNAYKTFVYWPANMVYHDKPAVIVCKANHNVNQDVLLGNTGQAQFHIPKPKKNNMLKGQIMANQTTMDFGDDDIVEEEIVVPEEDFQLRPWHEFTKKMEMHSTNVMGVINYVFYCDIGIYKCMEKFFLSFAKMDFLKYQVLHLPSLEQGRQFYIDWQAMTYEIIQHKIKNMPRYNR
ncbi:MAG: hypothetical protein J5701_07540 [Bacteroidales bacterium]|nr:hypothetical protein [Bacteroidales bacterium]